MQENKLTVKINKSVSEVFEFTLNPKNTPLWIKYVDFETTSTWPVKVGTTYENHSKKGQVFTFRVTELVKDDHFELEEVGSPSKYQCRYTFRKLSEDSTEFEYYEWVRSGELHFPFTQDILEKLKQVMES